MSRLIACLRRKNKQNYENGLQKRYNVLTNITVVTPRLSFATNSVTQSRALSHLFIYE